MVVQGFVSEVAKRTGVDKTLLEHDVDVVGRASGLDSQVRSDFGAVPRLTASPIRRHAADLIGRDAERGVLDRLLDDVRGGVSRALVVHGEAGMGKTALLEYVAERASGCRVVSVAGIQSEMEFGFAALHQLCAPLLGHLDMVSAAQRNALNVTFGM